MYQLHAVIVKKTIPLTQAKKMAHDIIKKNVSYYRVTSDSYRFRAIPKTKFKVGSFRSKPINENITLVFGELK